MRIHRWLIATILMTAMLAIAVAITTNQPYLHQFDTWGLHLAGQTTTTRTNWARTITNWGSPVGW
ncbi:hypothetical protein [Lacticaseibacillus thailandensis]|uniref:hypothetical protein n=1 Tax=Lacticaseibacillus thailandensis TaxID=381741 RepID=UPI0006CF6679|nr:hypothetical protein [Lacticaseibacillus thailandensis]